MRLAAGVMLWLLVLALSSVPIATGAAESLRAAFPWLSDGVVIQGTILVASVALAAALSRGKLSAYGFRGAALGQLARALVAGVIAAFAVHALRIAVSSAFPRMGGHPSAAGASFAHIVITIWILASTSEEVLHRGLIQSFLSPLGNRGITVLGVRLTLPAIAAGVLFGATHIMLLTVGAQGIYVGFIVGSAVVLGIVAGYWREKTGSLVPAVLVHMLFNVTGEAFDWVWNLLTR
ncbi:MAG: CPBP family intramembrane metalloprotease [Candidatus Eisenbacteria bacterium]|nr:CPBP family intramembrane metalloprotease [Candidatus Eisenbacteria bacterium]